MLILMTSEDWNLVRDAVNKELERLEEQEITRLENLRSDDGERNPAIAKVEELAEFINTVASTQMDIDHQWEVVRQLENYYELFITQTSLEFNSQGNKETGQKLFEALNIAERIQEYKTLLTMGVYTKEIADNIDVLCEEQSSWADKMDRMTEKYKAFMGEGWVEDTEEEDQLDPSGLDHEDIYGF